VQRHNARGEHLRVHVRAGRGLAQLSPLVPVGLSGRRVRAVLQPDHYADRLFRRDGLGVGQEVRYSGHGPEPSDQARGRHALQVRPSAVEGWQRACGRRRDLRGAVLAGGTVGDGRRARGRGSEGLSVAKQYHIINTLLYTITLYIVIIIIIIIIIIIRHQWIFLRNIFF